MLNEILNLGKLNIFVDGNTVEIEDAKKYLCEITTDCYLAPCMAMAEEKELEKGRQSGTWLEITFDDIMTYNDFDFEKLLINLYPKHDFLVMHRFVDEKYQGKSITVNLCYKTTELYKYINNFAKGLKNEK